MQFFKGDEQELKMFEFGRTALENASVQKDLFFEGAFDAAPLGDAIFDSDRSPLTNAIVRSIFRDSFNTIFEAFVVAGSFESYLTVFRKIFGETVEVTFTVPAPGKLNILVESDGFEISRFITRYIEDNEYFFDNTITQDAVDNIVFQTVKGFQTEYELELMLREMVPAGIFTDIDLEIAGA